MTRLPGECPMCHAELIVRSLACPACGIKIEGDFAPPKILSLTNEQLEFIMVFLRARGNIREVERELGVSYPTVRGRLDEIVSRLGIETEGRKELNSSDVLIALESGELSVEEALRRLKGENQIL
jgi:hypothetical protein